MGEDEELDKSAHLPPNRRSSIRPYLRRRRSAGSGRVRPVKRPGARATADAARHLVTGSVYISADDPREILDALAELGGVCGFTITRLGEPEIGSWFQRLGLSLRPGAKEKLADLAAKAERAAELHAILQVRSQNDEREANAVGRLIEALGTTETAVIQISSIILVKVDGAIVSKVLTEEQVKHLAHNPDLLKDPRAVLDALKQQMPSYADGRPQLGAAPEEPRDARGG